MIFTIFACCRAQPHLRLCQWVMVMIHDQDAWLRWALDSSVTAMTRVVVLQNSNYKQRQRHDQNRKVIQSQKHNDPVAASNMVRLHPASAAWQ